ncbi:helicase C-terminal domain-containing protein [Tribonema minus]|uniref:Helicase C-terminal domain-containing protein n=1 Tax=Tribonema minus TaxID=303371 RepID=A0A836CDC4_9STRA|nr:helicase C-terminal domain-containing protein [Tribonema minus]
MAHALQNFKRRMEGGHGALLLAVFRGKISEGIDFPDRLCRMVVCVGIPFGALDTQTRCKKEYQDAQHKANRDLHLKSRTDGWASRQAFLLRSWQCTQHCAQGGGRQMCYARPG